MSTSKKTIKVKIAVLVSETGAWEAYGCSHIKIERMRDDLLRGWDGDVSSLNVHTLEVELTIPEPAPDLDVAKVTYFRRVPHPADPK